MKKAIIWKIAAVLLGSAGPCFYMKIFNNVGGVSGVVYFLFLGGLGTLFSNYLLNTFIKENKIKKITISPTLAKDMVILTFSYAGTYFFYVATMNMQSITEATVLVRISPVLAIFLSVAFLREKINDYGSFFGGVFLCFIGFLLSHGIDSISLTNLFNLFSFFALLTALCIATIRVVGKKINDSNCCPTLVFNGLAMFFSSFIIFPYLVANGIVFVPEPKYLLYLFLIGLVTIGLNAVCNLRAYDLAGIRKVEMFDYLMPIIVSIYAYFINKESGFNYTVIILSFLFISFGVYLASFHQKN